VLVVDGQAKTDFKSHGQALKAARELKGRFPMLQIKMGCAADRKCQRTEAKTNNRLEMLDYFDFGRQKEV
jgi:hypothetical protein